jgi:hypothetical protein
MHNQRYDWSGLFFWLLTIPTLSIYVGYFIFSRFFKGIDELLIAICFFVGIIITFRYGARPGSSKVALSCFLGVTISFMISAIVANYIHVWMLLLGGFLGSAIAILRLRQNPIK